MNTMNNQQAIKSLMLLILIFVACIFGAGCNPQSTIMSDLQVNVQNAKRELNSETQDDRPPLGISFLIDNSSSYKPFLAETLRQTEEIVGQLNSKSTYKDTSVSFVVIDSQPQPVFSGTVSDNNLQSGLKELSGILQNEQSQYTNISDSVQDSIYFLNRKDYKRRILLVFSDMEESRPDYYPAGADTVPPPQWFDWKSLNDSGIETYCIMTSIPEWRLWQQAYRDSGSQFRFAVIHPEEIKSKSVYGMLFPEIEAQIKSEEW